MVLESVVSVVLIVSSILLTSGCGGSSPVSSNDEPIKQEEEVKEFNLSDYKTKDEYDSWGYDGGDYFYRLSIMDIDDTSEVMIDFYKSEILSNGDEGSSVSCSYFVSPDEITNPFTFNLDYDYDEISDGLVTLTFKDNAVELELKDVKPSKQEWRFENGKITMTKCIKKIWDRMSSESSDYEEENTPSSSNNSSDDNELIASDFYKKYGLTEKSFKEKCEIISYDKQYKSSIIDDSGMRTDSVYPNNDYEDLMEYPDKYIGCFYHDPSTNNEVILKDISDDGYTYYVMEDNTFNESKVCLIDMRDNIHSPNISVGDRIRPYMVFLGLSYNDGGEEVMLFKMITMDTKNVSSDYWGNYYKDHNLQ